MSDTRNGMTPATVRKAMIAYGQAVLAAFRADPRDNGPEDMDRIFGAIEPARDEAIRAVLAAADAGETEGPYTVTHHPETVGQYECWQVHEKDHEAFPWQECAVVFFAEPEARAVCNGLNRVAARERGVGQ